MKLCVAVVFLAVYSVAGSRINGARVSGETQNAYRVSLRYAQNNVHICGGVIVAPDWILTSARCVNSFDGDDLRAVYGAQRLSGACRSKDIDMVFVHPQYNTTTYENDIAMLLTKSKIEYVINVVGEVQLATEPVVDGEAITASTWGLKKGNPEEPIEFYPHNMQYQQTTVMPLAECEVETGRLSKYLHGEKTICTRNGATEDGITKGDLGSALISDSGRLVGIASWFTGGLGGKPDVYTAIAPYESWIQSLIEQHEAFFG